MTGSSTYRDLMLLMAGVLSMVVLGGVVLLKSIEQPPARLADLEPYDALRLLMAREYARVAGEWRIAPDVTIAIGSGLSEDAMEVVRRFGHSWMPEQSWEDNRGIPPPGTVLVEDLRIAGDSGFVAIVVGEVAGDLACGYKIDSRYSWHGRWNSPDESRVVMC